MYLLERAKTAAEMQADTAFKFPTPTGITALPIGTDTLNVGWTLPTDMQAGTAFKVYVDTVHNQTVQWPTNSATIGSLTADQSYSIQVSVINGTSEGSKSTAVNISTGPAATVKNNTGHYIDFLRYINYHPNGLTWTQARWADVLAGTATPRTGVKGIMVRNYWRDVETSEGVYDWTILDAALEFGAANGLQVVMHIADRTFNADQNLPDYLMTDYSTYYEDGGNTGYTAHRWELVLRNAWVNMMDDLATNYDDNPYFEGVMGEETSVGASILADLIANEGYTQAGYRNGLIDIIDRSCDAFAKSRYFFNFNYFPGADDINQFTTIFEATKTQTNLTILCTDILPYSTGLNSRQYPLFTTYDGVISLGGMSMNVSYRHCTSGGWTSGPNVACSTGTLVSMTEIFEFLRDDLNGEYMWWTWQWPTSVTNDMQDAYPVIAANPTLPVP